ncbi:hypothetical protein ACSFBM_09920 [Variovorax sp. GB1R11]|uniref:hypothetical protein n=1 Tax=Variovorax sp. GB1R11 TaxID=3443741 RepID=UPI003F446F99
MPSWKSELHAGPIYRGGVSFLADVSWGDAVLCRLVYAGPKRTNEEAYAALSERARRWIAGYEARSPATPLVGSLPAPAAGTAAA